MRLTSSGNHSALSDQGFRVGEGNGVGYQKPERPEGCFAFLVPAPLFRHQLMIQPQVLGFDKAIVGQRKFPAIKAGRQRMT